MVISWFHELFKAPKIPAITCTCSRGGETPKIAGEVKDLQERLQRSSVYCSMSRLTAALGKFVLIIKPGKGWYGK